jgi:hypothetical protein
MTKRNYCQKEKKGKDVVYTRKYSIAQLLFRTEGIHIYDIIIVMNLEETTITPFKIIG